MTGMKTRKFWKETVNSTSAQASLMQISAYQQKSHKRQTASSERIQRAECFLYSFFVSFGKGGLNQKYFAWMRTFAKRRIMPQGRNYEVIES